MEMEKPTQEQIKEFWEWCGLEYRRTETEAGGNPGDEEPVYYLGWFAPDGKFLSFRASGPIIDLNNLFKYAWTPILFKVGSAGWLHILNKWAVKVAMEAEDPALALFWAIWQVKPKEKPRFSLGYVDE